MSEIIRFKNGEDTQWCYECECGCCHFFALAVKADPSKFSGFQCSECEKVYMFEEEINGR